MILQSKYNFGETVFYILANEVHSAPIWDIFMSYQDGKTTKVEYYLNNKQLGKFTEKFLFHTKEELLKSL